jgi:hypothetical protein
MLVRTVIFGSVALAVLVTPISAQAQPSSKATAEPAPSAESEMIAPQPPRYAASSSVTSEEEGKRARKVLDALASRERSLRVAGSYAGLIVGATTLGVGVVAETQSDKTYGIPIWIIGGTFVFHGVLGLVTRGPLETLASQADAESDAGLRDRWGSMARSARSERQVEGWLNVALGTMAVGAGTALAVGAGDLTSGERTGWSVAMLFTGGAVAGVGVASLITLSEAELGYRAAYGAAPPPPPMRVGFGALPGGGAFSLRGTF